MSKEIFDGLQKIFSKRFNINLEAADNGKLDKKLLGNEWRFGPRDLLYLFCDIENEFGISISEEKIENGNFDSINNIANIIASCLA